MPATSCARAGALVLVVAVCTSAALAQNRVWIRQFGGFGYQSAEALTGDGSGGVVVAGTTEGTFLGQGFGSSDAFLLRFNAFGNPGGGVRFGSISPEQTMCMTPAGDGGAFVAGYTTGSFGGASAGGIDAWITRHDMNGGVLWVRQLGGTAWDYVLGGCLCGDGAGGAIVAGNTLGSVGGPNAGGIDTWMARYDSDGARLWLRQFGSPSIESPSCGLVPAAGGGFFMGGTTSGDLFGTNSGDADAWLARFDGQGEIIWARQFGTPQFEVGRGLCPDGSGGVFVVGDTEGVMAGTTPGGIWVARYDAKGNRTSLVQFPFNAGSSASPYAVCADGMGGLYMGGVTVGAFGGPSAGGNDAFIAHVRNGTQLAWVHRFGTPAYDTSRGLALAGPGRVFVCGYTGGNIITGGGTGGGSYDAWVALYESCYADCNADGALSLADFACFQTKYLATDPYADCNNDGAVNLADFGCFQTRYVLGCP
jgi:hypothetical protein